MTGCKDLDEMLKTLQALNHGLQTVCKPIMAYDDDRVERLIESVKRMVAESNLQDGASEAQLSQVYSHSSSPSHLQNETVDPLMQYTAKPFLLSSQPPALVHSVEVNALNLSAASQAAKQVAQSAQSFPTQDVFQACLSMLNAAIGELLKVESEGYQRTVALLQSSQTKMKIWGCSVFVVPFHLDQIFP